ncbi:unnamed protein product [Tetraodon nigroviridis]|uniref:Chromosome 3 SCAF14978, whole genome shotgun sequence n=1 Tax=Tetraodon nigroviridis TaxID=99883 RepID=Q4RY70_TETNG|nr:unnamed protein product [Tetraodon nigroviridis]
MNSAEQTVTWLITLGVLESPKKSISDPEAFLQASLQDGAVLCAAAGQTQTRDGQSKCTGRQRRRKKKEK